MSSMTHKKIEFYLKALLVAVVIGLIILCGSLLRQYRYLRHLNFFNVRESWSTILHTHPTATASSISTVQSWMTFDYINHLFAVSPQYLQTSLGITDKRYPHLTIVEYGKDMGFSRAVSLVKVQSALSAYFSQKQ